MQGERQEQDHSASWLGMGQRWKPPRPPAAFQLWHQGGLEGTDAGLSGGPWPPVVGGGLGQIDRRKEGDSWAGSCARAACGPSV